SEHARRDALRGHAPGADGALGRDRGVERRDAGTCADGREQEQREGERGEARPSGHGRVGPGRGWSGRLTSRGRAGSVPSSTDPEQPRNLRRGAGRRPYGIPLRGLPPNGGAAETPLLAPGGGTGDVTLQGSAGRNAGGGGSRSRTPNPRSRSPG